VSTTDNSTWKTLITLPLTGVTTTVTWNGTVYSQSAGNQKVFVWGGRNGSSGGYSANTTYLNAGGTTLAATHAQVQCVLVTPGSSTDVLVQVKGAIAPGEPWRGHFTLYGATA
jgi:hypothetical protein